MAKLSIGIIGIGTIATSKHITSLLKIPEAEIVALCDIEPDRCEKAKAQFSLPAAKVYTDYRAL